MNRIQRTLYQALRLTERLVKTDMVYAGSGGFWLVFSQGMAMGMSLLLAIAFANLVEPEKYGNYKYILSLAAVIGALSLSGLTTAVTRGVARGHDQTLTYAYRSTLTWSAGMVIISIFLAGYYLYQNNILLGISLLIIGGTAPFIASTSLYRPFLAAKKKFKLAAFCGLLQGGVPTALVLIGLLLQLPLLALIALYFFSSAFVLWFLYQQAQAYIENTSVDPLTGYLGKHLSIMGIISVVANKLDSILLFQLLGGAELAIFALATALPDSIRGAFKHVETLAMPKFVQKTTAEMKQAVWSKTKLTFVVTGLVAIIYALIAPFLFSLLFPVYADTVAYTQWYALIIPMTFILSSSYFDAQGIVKERYVLSFIDNGSRIVLVVLGIVFFGIWGALGARLMSRALKVGLSAYFIARH